MRLTDRFRPTTLEQVIGQSCIPLLMAYAESPYSACWAFEGNPGVGKTSAAYALANDLGSSESTTMIPCSELNTDRCREVMRSLALKPMFGGGRWQLLLLEELETLHPQCQTLLKVGLENLPRHAIVIATSNNSEKLQPALVQRFNRLIFESGKAFADAARVHLASIWANELPGVPLPPAWQTWGLNDNREFSVRVALDKMEMALLGRKGKVLV